MVQQDGRWFYLPSFITHPCCFSVGLCSSCLILRLVHCCPTVQFCLTRFHPISLTILRFSFSFFSSLITFRCLCFRLFGFVYVVPLSPEFPWNDYQRMISKGSATLISKSRLNEVRSVLLDIQAALQVRQCATIVVLCLSNGHPCLCR